MNRYEKCLLWFLLGPVGSVVMGYAAFILFAFVLGSGFDIDDKPTAFQDICGSMAMPALGIVSVVGVVLSFRKAYLTLRDG